MLAPVGSYLMTIGEYLSYDVLFKGLSVGAIIIRLGRRLYMVMGRMNAHRAICRWANKPISLGKQRSTLSAFHIDYRLITTSSPPPSHPAPPHHHRHFAFSPLTFSLLLQSLPLFQSPHIYTYTQHIRHTLLQWLQDPTLCNKHTVRPR